jgi:periplasmic protein TonB
MTDSAATLSNGLPPVRLWARALVPPFAPADLSRPQYLALAAVVLLVHGVAAWVAWHGEPAAKAVIELAPIEVSLISSEPALRPAPLVPPTPAMPLPVTPPMAPARQPAPAPHAAAANVAPTPPMLASARPAERTEMAVPAATTDAHPAPVTPRTQAASMAPPTAPASPQPAPPLDATRQPSPARVLPASAVRYLVAPVLQYPRVSRDMGESGSVRLKVLVDEQGRPKEIEILKSCGFPRLDQQAVLAMKAARFQPLIEDGAPRAAWVTPGALVFNLEEQ